jgi:hypothetical protein
MRTTALTRRLLHNGLATLLVAALLYAGVNLYFHRPKSQTPPQNSPPTAHAPLRLAMQGVRFSADYAGQPSLEIRADRVALKKKKMGLLRFGLLNEAVFSNARVDLFSSASAPQPSSTGPTPAEPAGSLPDSPIHHHDPLAVTGRTPSFAMAFAESSLASLPIKNVTGVRFAPILLRLHDSGRVAVSVTAEQASVNPQTQEVRFSGNACWKSGVHVLRAETLVASFSDGTVRASGAYRLSNHAENVSGRDLRSDLFLTSFGQRSSPVPVPTHQKRRRGN